MSGDGVFERPVRVRTDGVLLDGDLAVLGGPPDEVRGIVLFAHGSGSSRHSPRNRRVAGVLQELGWVTLLLDLMTVEELRGLLPEGEHALTEEEERGYLVGQLRAVASGPTAAQSAQVGSARPGESLPAPSGVQDKDLGRG